MPPSPTTPAHDEIDLADLPPLDGGEGEDREAPGEGDADGGDDGADATPGGLDDSTGEDDAPHPDDLEVDAGEGQWLDEPADAQNLEIGEVDLDTPEVALSALDGDEPATTGDDLGVGDDLGASGLDSGEEGPQGPDEELRDQDLPELGQAQDDEGAEDLVLADASASWNNDEPLGLSWATKPWQRVGAPVPITEAISVACSARGVFVAGQLDAAAPPALWRVDLEGSCVAVVASCLKTPPRRVAADGDLLAVETDRAVFSAEAGVDFTAIQGRESGLDIVLASGKLWARSETGSLLVALPRGAWREAAARASIGALAADGAGQIAALVTDEAGMPVGVLRSLADGTLQTEGVDFALAAPGSGPCAPGVMAAHGGQLAFGTRGGVVCGSVDRGWKVHPLRGSVVALTFVEAGDALLAVTYADADDTTGLVRIRQGDRPAVVALLGPSQGDPDGDRRAAAASDELRGVVWVVGGFGVAAFSTR